MSDADLDRKMLLRAVAISGDMMRARRGGPFGAVIARGDRILAEGCNEVTTALDPTAHAEVVAIRAACRAVGRFDLAGATLYASCEPCPMCLAAAYWARLDRLVFANTRHDAAKIGFDDELLYREVAKPIGDRLMPTEHRPLAEALAIFAEWETLSDKVPY